MKNFLVAFAIVPILFAAPLVLAGITVIGETGESGTTVTGTTGPAPAEILGIDQKIKNPINQDSFSQLIATLISSVVYILSPFLVLAFVYVGFLFVQAQGKEDKITEAKDALLWTVVGAFVLMGALGFSKIIESTIKTLGS